MSDEEKTTIEFGGMSFTGGKAFALVTALSTLGGASWGWLLSSTKITWT